MKQTALLSAFTALVVTGVVFFGRSESRPARCAVAPKTCSTKPPIPSSQLNESKTSAVLANPVLTEQPVVQQPQEETSAETKLAQQLTSITTDYKDMAQGIYEQSPPLIRPEDREKLTFLEKEKTADLATVLTAEELELYQLKADETAAPRRR
jgi:hypothetical protein